MKSFALSIVTAASLSAFFLSAASAEPSKPKPKAPACCRLRANTMIMVELGEDVGTKTQKSGDTFALSLAEPVVVNGKVVLPAGTRGVGRVIEISKPGLGGKPGRIVLAAKSVDYHGKHIGLQALQLSGAGKGKGAIASAAGLTGIAFAPLGFAALAIKGGDVTFPAGTKATAKISNNVTLAALGPAPAGFESESAQQSARQSQLPPSDIALPAPPTGKGLVVFYRRKSLLGTGQWFNVREEGKALGKLSNGAYFTETVAPGEHTYTASLEPEFKDKLKLQIDPGETYFVEGDLAKGVVLSTAVLQPSDRGAFNLASKDLKPAPAPGDDKEEAAQKAADSPSKGG